MSTSLENLVLESRFDARLSPRAQLLYLLLRADVLTNHTSAARDGKTHGHLVSGLTLDRVAMQFGCVSELAAQSVIELRRAGLLRGCDGAWRLGEVRDFQVVWGDFSEGDVKSLDRVIEESAAMCVSLRKEEEAKRSTNAASNRLHRNIASNVMGENQTKPLHREVVDLFADAYLEKYDESLPTPTKRGDDSPQYALNYVWAKNAVRWCSHDVDMLSGMIEFLFANWDAIQSSFAESGLQFDRPELRMFGTFRLLNTIRGWYLAGDVDAVPKSRNKKSKDITHRHKDDGESYDEPLRF